MEINDRIPRETSDGAQDGPGKNVISMSRAEFEELQARIASLESASSTSKTPENHDSTRAIDVAGHATGEARQCQPEETSRELTERGKRITELEYVCKEAIRDREIATALVGRPLVKGAATQLVRIWRDEIDVLEQDGGYRVLTRGGKPLAQAVDDWLSSPEYAHFCVATSRGGAGSRGTGRSETVEAKTSPRTLGEAAVMKWRDLATNRAESFLKPIGLKRRH